MIQHSKSMQKGRVETD